MAALEPQPAGDQERAEEEEPRCHHIGQNAHVGIAVMREQVDGEEQQEREYAARRHDGSGEHDPVLVEPGLAVGSVFVRVHSI